MLVPAIDHIRTFVDNLHTFSERLLLTLHVYLLLFDNLAVLLFRTKRNAFINNVVQVRLGRRVKSQEVPRGGILGN
jgi:hypothetical protein